MSGTSFLVPADAIVIDRAELPEVTQIGTHHYRVGAESFDPQGNASRYREWAREFLALAEYLDAHPPVDEADVETLVKAIITRVPGSHPVAMVPADQTRDVIRALLATGKVTVTRDE